MHSALYALIDDARRHEALAQRSEESLASPRPGSTQDEELALFLREIAHRSREHAEEARRMLAQRVAE